jgi:hypothetical protein
LIEGRQSQVARSRSRCRQGRSNRTAALSALAALLALAVAAPALGHLERPSYWPDPRPDRSITPAAGGEVPDARPLGTAVTGGGPGEVRVACRGRDGVKSLDRLRHSIRDAQTSGFRLRPSQPKTFISDQRAADLLRINRALARQCEYHTVQNAVEDSGNNDRVVVMPGHYREKPSRRQPTNDPRCVPELLQDNGSGGMAPSYEYQTTCPNDQNLIYVQGRAVPPEPPPEPPRPNREGIPDLGRCLRCNLQLEGSGVKPTDVIMDAGRHYRHNDRPGDKPGMDDGCDFQPECTYAKDVVLRVDRADGFVGRNFLTRGSTEHGVYIEEVDGYLLDRTKFFWSADYGNLTFTSDHGLYKNCDSFGAGDAAVYPGAAPESGVDVENTDFYPDAPRINTVVRDCDLRSSALAYSGSQGNAVRITHNEIYANTTGVVSDSISASGHPGYPPDSIEVDHNNIYSNNLDSYGEDAPFENLVGLPIGVGIMWPGVNSSTVHHNHIFDNYRRGTMLLAVPDEATRGEPEDPSRSACEKPPPQPPEQDDPVSSTSCENTYRANVMGRAPRGFRPSVAVDKFGNRNSFEGGQQDRNGVRNGVDFWWDEFPANEGNCWAPSNVGFRGTHRSITSDPVHNPEMHGKNIPPFLPEECDPDDPTWAAGIRTGHGPKEAELVNCGTQAVPQACPWFDNPEEPGTAAAAREQRRLDRDSRRLMRTELGAAIRENLRAFSTVAERR